MFYLWYKYEYEWSDVLISIDIQYRTLTLTDLGLIFINISSIIQSFNLLRIHLTHIECLLKTHKLLYSCTNQEEIPLRIIAKYY